MKKMIIFLLVISFFSYAGNAYLDSSLSIKITTPVDGAVMKTPVITVNGTASPEIVTVKINGSPTQLMNGTFSQLVQIFKGGNTITAEGFDDTGATVKEQITVQYNLSVDITTPADGSHLNSLQAVVSGITSSNISALKINDIETPVNNGTFRKTLKFKKGPNTIFVKGWDIFNNSAEDQVTVYCMKDKDYDDDGLDETEESEYGTDPLNADTDSDGLTDGEEVKIYGTDPLSTDSDNDGLSDSKELKHGTFPVMKDTDCDGLHDGEEIEKGSNPLDKFSPHPYDTDSSGIIPKPVDIQENIRGTTNVLSFTTTVPCRAFVYYGKEGPYSQFIKTTELTKNHAVELKNLEYNTEYFYTILIMSDSGAEGRTEEHKFKSEDFPSSFPGPMNIQIFTPDTSLSINENFILVTGTVNRPNAVVTINRNPAETKYDFSGSVDIAGTFFSCKITYCKSITLKASYQGIQEEMAEKDVLVNWTPPKRERRRR